MFLLFVVGSGDGGVVVVVAGTSSSSSSSSSSWIWTLGVSRPNIWSGVVPFEPFRPTYGGGGNGNV